MTINIKKTIIIIILALLYCFTGKLSVDFQAHVNLSNFGIFAAEGVSLAFALYFGAWVWPGVLIGQLVLALLNGFTPMTALEISVINSFEVLLAVKIFEIFKFDIRFESLKSLLLFALVVLAVLQPFSALLSNLFLLWHGLEAPKIFWQATFAWWFGNVMGQLIITPFLLTFFTHFASIRMTQYLLYAIIYALFLYTIEILLKIDNPMLLFGAALPPAIYVVANKSIAYGAMMTVVAAVISSWAIYHKTGPFCSGDTLSDTLNYNLFLLASQAIVLSMGALFEERRLREVKLQKAIDEALKTNQEQQMMLARQSRLAQMGEMIAMIAHQWRQPLNNLSLVNQLLISKYKKGQLDEKAITQFKTNAQKQIALMSSTIDDFRNFFKSDEKKVPFDIDDVIQNVIAMTEAIFKSHGIQLLYKSQNGLRTYGYPNTLAQALLNIINNAKDALLSTSKESMKYIKIVTKKQKGKIIIRIEDNGGGIPQEIIDKIFDPYFSTKNEKNGTGLGLYMSKTIIEKQMAGRIDVINTPNGALFTIYLQEFADDAQ